MIMCALSCCVGDGAGQRIARTPAHAVMAPAPQHAHKAWRRIPWLGRRRRAHAGAIRGGDTYSTRPVDPRTSLASWPRAAQWHCSSRRASLDTHATPPPCAARDYGLNLSISISPGAEINRDPPSSGERTADSRSRIPSCGARARRLRVWNGPAQTVTPRWVRARGGSSAV